MGKKKRVKRKTGKGGMATDKKSIYGIKSTKGMAKMRGGGMAKKKRVKKK
tara:strand:+ start:3185 stop:3334 length:150 start_codon:yes stop_codon:yes gene_type:complete